MTRALSIKDYDNTVIQDVAGTFDKNIRHIERDLGIDITIRADLITIEGRNRAAEEGALLLKELIELAARGEFIDDQKVNYTMLELLIAIFQFI